ncbi:MAG: FecR domain-containing protein [Gallionella sp.]
MSHEELDDPRRRWLIQAIASGLLTAGLPATNVWAERFFGSAPSKLPVGRSVYRISGEATVNGKEVTPATIIKPGDALETAEDSELIFAVNGSHAMILRGGSNLVLEAEKKEASSWIINGLRLLTGKLLSVSRDSRMQVRTNTATLGIRGTGFYVESDPEQTYFCTCYGTTDVVANADPTSKTTVVATHHDRPLYIVKDGGEGNNIRNAPFINHTDQELTLIEALVGRTTPFVFENDAYSAPRREY